MRWKTKYSPYSRPSEKEPYTIARKFAFLPTKTRDDITVWIGFYWVKWKWSRPYPSIEPYTWKKNECRYYAYKESAEMIDEN
jgi:hypothetical protein